jgi:hypothetical protein
MPYLNEWGLVPGGVGRPAGGASGGCCNGTHSGKAADGSELAKCVGDGSYGNTYNQGMFVGAVAFLHRLNTTGSSPRPLCRELWRQPW